MRPIRRLRRPTYSRTMKLDSAVRREHLMSCFQGARLTMTKVVTRQKSISQKWNSRSSSNSSFSQRSNALLKLCQATKTWSSIYRNSLPLKGKRMLYSRANLMLLSTKESFLKMVKWRRATLRASSFLISHQSWSRCLRFTLKRSSRVNESSWR